MSSPLLSVYVITKTKNIFLKLINILESTLYLYAVFTLLKIDNIRHSFLAIVKFLYICLDTIWF